MRLLTATESWAKEQIEAILNSRQMCSISSDHNDLSALTPGHFLVESALSAISEENLVDIQMNGVNHFQLLSQMQ